METDWRAHVGRDGGLARVGLEQRERVRRAGTARRHEVEPDSLRVAWRALPRPSVAVRASLEFRHVCRLFKDVRHLDVEDVPDASSEPFDRVALFVAVRAHYEFVVAQQIDDPQLWWFAFFDFEAALAKLHRGCGVHLLVVLMFHHLALEQSRRTAGAGRFPPTDGVLRYWTPARADRPRQAVLWVASTRS